MIEIQDTSPVTRVLSGEYTIVYGKKSDCAFVEHVTTGKTYPASHTDLETIRSYEFMNVIYNNEYLTRYGTTKAAVREVKKKRAL